MPSLRGDLKQYDLACNHNKDGIVRGLLLLFGSREWGH